MTVTPTKSIKKRRRAAGRLPARMQDVAGSKWFAKGEAKQRANRGTFGAASPVRRIDPKTGLVIEESTP